MLGEKAWSDTPFCKDTAIIFSITVYTNIFPIPDQLVTCKVQYVHDRDALQG